MNTDDSQPFHTGEVSIQKRLGVYDRVATIGKRLIRDHLTDEHSNFFPLLPTLLVGSRDSDGRMWASILAAPPGFVRPVSPTCLHVDARPTSGDPLSEALTPGASLGLLGLQFETRRRNRISGSVKELLDHGFALMVAQAFGNCPKYIQTRAPDFVIASPSDPIFTTELGPEDRTLIANSDTFFIASGVQGKADDPRAGNDVSHRGGRPGFVRVEGNVLTWPDFVGNFLFNTLGNLEIDDRAGLLFIDFTQGDTLQLSGRAQVLWDAPYQQEYAGAERFVRFVVERVVRIPAALPLRWKFDQASPFNAQTGIWPEVERRDIP